MSLAAELAAFAQQLGPRPAMNRPVYSASTEQRGVRGIDDGVHGEGGDVGVKGVEGGGHADPAIYGDSTAWEARSAAMRASP